MKRIRVVFFNILIIASLHGYSQGNISVEVSGDTVTLWQTAAWRNCGALYIMELNQEDYNITWYQIDTGQAAYCMCYFDLSVTFLLPEPGDYHADVYYTESMDQGNLIYQGSVDFSIGSGDKYALSEIITYFQSDCYEFAGQDESFNKVPDIRIYPQPLTDGQELIIEVDAAGNQLLLEIYAPDGILLFSKTYEGSPVRKVCFKKNELFPVAGIYIARFTLSEKIYVRRILSL